MSDLVVAKDKHSLRFTAAMKVEELLEALNEQIPVEDVYALDTDGDQKVTYRRLGQIKLEFFPSTYTEPSVLGGSFLFRLKQIFSRGKA